MLEQKFQTNLDLLLAEIISSKIAIAVSGGVDSTALLMLLSKWSRDKAVEITVLTVDHNLRPESIDEARYVCNLSNNLGYQCMTLSWDHQNNYSNLSARARKGRYQLMTEFCLKQDILTLLVGHHQNDMIENFLIREERKSGVLGLSSNSINYYNNIRILRPLYNITKNELVQYLKFSNIKWFEDISNQNTKYLRNKIRNNLSESSEDLNKKITQKLAEVDFRAKSINSDLIIAMAESATIYQYGLAVLDITKFCSYCYEVKLRLIGLLLNIISGNRKLPRADSIDMIIKLLTGQAEDFSKTLHGCCLKRTRLELLIFRGFGKIIPRSLEIKSQQKIKWDDRFSLEYHGDMKNLYVTHFSKEDFLEIKSQLDLDRIKKLIFCDYKNILFTLPVLKILEKVVALPHISYYNDHNFDDKIEISFQPNFTSRFIHF
ncbi:MAG: tRNA lysidine(34) synthetase TilS [Janthinobacterium lividum]